MKLLCPTCKCDVPVLLIFHAESEYNTETKETENNDVDFSHAECAVCHTWLGDDSDIPELRPILIELGWRQA